jgi:hypothetical protein
MSQGDIRQVESISSNLLLLEKESNGVWGRGYKAWDDKGSIKMYNPTKLTPSSKNN